jgi:hypothetical protein
MADLDTGLKLADEAGTVLETRRPTAKAIAAAAGPATVNLLVQ